MVKRCTLYMHSPVAETPSVVMVTFTTLSMAPVSLMHTSTAPPSSATV